LVSPSEDRWNNRELYVQSPQRYQQVASMQSIRELFVALIKQWKRNRKSIGYVDLGSGDCKGTRFFANFLGNLAAMPVETVGIDASSNCEVACREQGIEFFCADLNLEALPPRNFQVVTMFETIEHIFYTDYLLQSIRKSISKDGVVLITTLNVVCWKNRILVPLGIQPFNTEVSTKKLSYGYKFKSLKKRMETWKPAGHIRPFTLYSLCEMLQDNGFTVIKTYGLENWKAAKFLETIGKNMCTGILVVAKPA
jgi:2-polyprenyl-3-methyl-5-hydroxy-6-metoxy-1,4-benzoquinol methylase